MTIRYSLLMLSVPILLFGADSVDEPLRQARNSFVRRDLSAASASIRRAADVLGREGALAGTDLGLAVDDSSKELGRLAVGVEKGTVKSVDELSAPFARACRAAADSHLAKASEAAARRSARLAGRELRGAADELEASFAWAGVGIDHTALSAIRGARDVGEHLERGAALSVTAADESLRALGRELRSAGARFARL